MSEYLRYVLRGTEILFGNEKIDIKRKKTLDTKKEIRISRAVRKTSMLQRSTNRVRKIVTEALS
jgi:hypothetical protein